MLTRPSRIAMSLVVLIAAICGCREDQPSAGPAKKPATAPSKPASDGATAVAPEQTEPVVDDSGAGAAATEIPEAYANWKPGAGPLFTRWGNEIIAEMPRGNPPVMGYPRPQMVRDAWVDLNGLWDYAIRAKDDPQPEEWDGKILVPFPVESALSGVMKLVGPENALWYRRSEIKDARLRKFNRLLLHFGSVDWEATVWVNGHEVGSHRGGYEPFSIDITDALHDVDNEIVVRVWDPTDASVQPRGKQVRKPEGIWYTSVTGIWQTVWLEDVPPIYIKRLKLVPDVDAGAVRVTAETSEPGDDFQVIAVASVNRNDVARAEGKANEPFELKVPDPRLWSTSDPFLYDLEVALSAGGRGTDSVGSYFGLRKIEIKKDEQGVNRLFLNNAPLFQYGPLDQGWWPDGLYTAPSDEALRYDIEITKQLGFNMIRKHVKVEPDRWYAWCDRLGMLVWQDMPNGDAHVAPNKGEITRQPESVAIYEREWQAIINARHNHPCIVMWVPFNEGWGQFETQRIVELTRKFDPTRLVDCASGWNDVAGVGDVHDIHVYPGPGAPPLESDRAAVLGEFGGLGLPVKGHTWQEEKNWGYRSFTSAEALTDAYLGLMGQLRPLIGAKGLAAAVYTQTTDVEIEVNGLLTYDRGVIKMPLEAIAAANEKMYLPPPTLQTVVPSAREEAMVWRFTTSKPADDWTQPDFEDAAWEEGPAGFGQRGTPGAVVRTEWTTNDIWLRRTFEMPEGQSTDSLHLYLHHDEDAEIYVNGQRVAAVTGYTVDYVTHPLSGAARKAFKPGKNTLAVHCRQTGGGQYIDVGVLEIVEQKAE